MHWLTLQTNATFVTATWNIDSVSEIVGCMLLTMTLAVTCEGLRFYMQCQEEIYSSNQFRTSQWRKKTGIIHCMLAFVNICKTCFICLLVLCINTFNIWVLLSACVGSGVGYLLLRPPILYLINKNSPRKGCESDIEMQPLFYQPDVVVDSNVALYTEENMVDRYFGSIRQHLDYLKKHESHQQKADTYQLDCPDVHLFDTTFCKEEQCPVKYKNMAPDGGQSGIPITELDNEERCKFVRDTFKRVSQKRLEMRKRNGLPARIEQMGGLTDSFEMEMDTWIQNDSDILNDRSTLLRKKSITMYISVV